MDHLDELRARVFICLGVLIVAFGICFWQNERADQRAEPGAATSLHRGQHGLAALPDRVGQGRKAPGQGRRRESRATQAPRRVASSTAACWRQAAAISQAAQALPSKTITKDKPITIGVGEPFTTTLTVAAYFALLFTLPLIIYQAYAFVIPALTPKERRVALPVMLGGPGPVPAGVVFAYLVVLPPAVHFLQGYNSGQIPGPRSGQGLLHV